MLALGLEDEYHDVSGCTLCVIFDLYFNVGVPGLDELEDFHVH